MRDEMVPEDEQKRQLHAQMMDHVMQDAMARSTAELDVVRGMAASRLEQRQALLDGLETAVRTAADVAMSQMTTCSVHDIWARTTDVASGANLLAQTMERQ